MKTLIISTIFLVGTVLGQECPPPVDPLAVQSKSNLNVTLDSIFKLNHGGSHTGGNLAGHSLSNVTVNINPILLTAVVNLRSANVQLLLNGVRATGYLDISPFTVVPSGQFVAAGDPLSVNVQGLIVDANAGLLVNFFTNRVTLRTLTLSRVIFNSASINGGSNFRIGGNPVNWDQLNASLKSNFDEQFGNQQLRNQLVERIRQAANRVVGNCTIAQLIACANAANDGCVAAQQNARCQCMLDMIYP